MTEEAALRAEAAGCRFRLASPTTALILGALTLALALLYLPLAYPTHDFANGLQALVALLAFSVPGVAVARRQPTNPIGWILLGLGIGIAFFTDAERYSVLAYHFHHGDLPLGHAAALVASNSWAVAFLALPLVILLFPDGRLSRPWRMVLWAYIAVAACLIWFLFGLPAWRMNGQPISVDANGHMINGPNPSGVLGALLNALLVALPVFWLSFVGRQVVSWRRSTGERRQQLKWLMGGSAISVVGLVADFVTTNSFSGSGSIATVVRTASFVAIFALPISIGVGILKYRLYDIDRLISRTLSYAIVTGLVIGGYVAVITLVTRVLGFSSPVAVAASTLAAVALFNPLRVRVQRSVDRRFNRAHYDAEAIIASFTARLRDAVDLETVRSELLEVVNRAVEPAHASVWIRQHNSN